MKAARRLAPDEVLSFILILIAFILSVYFVLSTPGWHGRVYPDHIHNPDKIEWKLTGRKLLTDDQHSDAQVFMPIYEQVKPKPGKGEW